MIRATHEEPMDLGIVPDLRPLDLEARIEGTAWCLRCQAQTPYGRQTVEFLGNAVKSTSFCLRCGERIHPSAEDHETARRLRNQGRRVKMGAALLVGLLLVLPILIVALTVWLLWRLL
jgi:hypothetical protein